MLAQIDRWFTPETRAIAGARHSLDELAGRVEEERLEVLRLLVSELVTNCLRHARLEREDRVRLRVLVCRTKIRVEVTDPGPGFEQRPGPPAEERTSGWGLLIVERLADRWGIDRGEKTRVWAELNCPEGG
jgi:anti-sigma regulatory factor (Ser/Thr protein kinase)